MKKKPEIVYPVDDCEQRWIDRMKNAAVLYLVGGSTFIIVDLFFSVYNWFNAQMLEYWNDNVEGMVPLINLAREG
jgi:hypothetical protein